VKDAHHDAYATEQAHHDHHLNQHVPAMAVAMKFSG
jgi:hypothetical protein